MHCSGCGYEAASLTPTINERVAKISVDESLREAGLKSLRVRNFQTLLSRINQRLTDKSFARKRLLDVGAAHGWFVALAAGQFECVGIEPDTAVREAAAAQGISLLEGYFPEALPFESKFEVIVFNDVFEHIPDVGNVLVACARHLSPEGLLVLNLPCSAGAIYRSSKMLYRLGWRGPFERMWQKDLASPHLHYFNRYSLTLLLKRNSFRNPAATVLPAVGFTGLYQRLHHASGDGTLKTILTWLLVVSALPFLRLFESDILAVISESER